MTNIEWLKNLSDNDLAEILSGVMCGYCAYEDVWDCNANCKNGIVLWLALEHKEDIKKEN